MDSQVNTPIEEQNAILSPATDTENVEQNVLPAEEASAASNVETERKQYDSKKAVLDRVREIAHNEEAPQKEEVDYLKTCFYKLHIAEREAKLKEYIDGGGDPEQYQITPDPDEEAFKAEMLLIKEKRQQLFKELEQEKQDNLQKKLDIIEKIKAMVTSPEEANKSYKEFKALQDEWRDIKNVPAERANELWRNYQLYVEQFYDLLKLNIEAREYDFKKNLEAKTHLCEAAEKLAEEDDVISAFHQLQKLHQEYRETGPVSKELREEIWNRFKAASTVVNKRFQQHYDNLRAKEEENLAKKTALCEKVEAIVAEENKGSADWERRTKEIIELQTEWKTIGFAPQKMNVKIFERFRAACDDFFGRKAEFFKNLKEQFKVNADKKRALIEKAKALQDSTDWKSTSDKLINLQKEWKTIGMVPKKLGDQLWDEFLGTCNKFFEARNAAGAGTRSEERENLEKKRDVIERLKVASEGRSPGSRRRTAGARPETGRGVSVHRSCALQGERQALRGVSRRAGQAIQGPEHHRCQASSQQVQGQPQAGGRAWRERPGQRACPSDAPVRAAEERGSDLREQPRFPERLVQEGQLAHRREAQGRSAAGARQDQGHRRAERRQVIRPAESKNIRNRRLPLKVRLYV